MTRFGKLNRIDRGIDLSDNGVYDDHFILQAKYPKIIFSYETALSLLNLTDKIPEIIEVIVNHHYKFNDKPSNINVNFVKKKYEN